MIYYHKGCAIEYAKEMAQTKKVLLMHGCNNIRAWGSGFVLALNKHWNRPMERYVRDHSCVLGDIQYVKVEENLWVVNAITQNGCGTDTIHHLDRHIETCPFKYDALISCCRKVQSDINLIEFNTNTEACVVMPKIGAGLGGGNWPVIARLIEDCITSDTYVCEL